MAPMDTNRDALRASLEQGLVFFTGAGISRSAPSNVPLSAEIIEVAVDALARAGRAPLGTHLSGARLDQAFRIASMAPMEVFLSALMRAAPDAVGRVFSGFSTATVNADHLAIAAAQILHPAKLVVTLNFDRLHEKALEALGRTDGLSLQARSDFRSRRPLAADRPVVAHLHGAIEEGRVAPSLVATIRTVGTGLAPERAALLRDALEQYDIVCAGYSNHDIDTFPILRRTNRRIFWYTHHGRIAPPVAEALMGLGGRAAVVRRREGEHGFADVLGSVSPAVARMMNCRMDGMCDEEISHRLAKLRDAVSELLGTDASRPRSVSLILAALADQVGERKLAKELLAAGRRFPTAAGRIPSAEETLLAHILERGGEVNDAYRAWRRAVRLAPEEDRAVLHLRLASAALGLWKRRPSRIHCYLTWRRALVRHRRDLAPEVVLRSHWQRGDFWHFLGEYVLVPSAWIAMRGRSPMPRLVAAADRVVLAFLGKLRDRWLRRAGVAYVRYLRSARRLSEDPLPDYTMLVHPRYCEVAAALSRVARGRVARTLMIEPEDYYRWTGTSHGIGNAICAKGIAAMYQGDIPEAMRLLDAARGHYGSHIAGQRKVDVFVTRALIWPALSLVPRRAGKGRMC